MISHARRALLSLPSPFALRVLRYYPTARDPTSSAGPPPGALRGQASRELRERLVIGLLRRAQPRARALWACARGFGERAVGALLGGAQPRARFAAAWEAQRWRPLYETGEGRGRGSARGGMKLSSPLPPPSPEIVVVAISALSGTAVSA